MNGYPYDIAGYPGSAMFPEQQQALPPLGGPMGPPQPGTGGGPTPRNPNRPSSDLIAQMFPGGAPGDKIAGQRKLADMLRAQAREQGSGAQAGRIYKAPGWGNALAAIAGNYMGMKQDDEAQKAAAAQGDTNSKANQAIFQFLAQRAMSGGGGAGAMGAGGGMGALGGMFGAGM